MRGAGRPAMGGHCLFERLIVRDPARALQENKIICYPGPHGVVGGGALTTTSVSSERRWF